LIKIKNSHALLR